MRERLSTALHLTLEEKNIHLRLLYKRLEIYSSIVLGACSRGLPCCKFLLCISHSTVTVVHCVSPWKQHIYVELLEREGEGEGEGDGGWRYDI